MIHTLEEKCTAAIAYLRSRNKYLLDGGKWVPTSSDKTDVKETIEKCRKEMGWK